MFNRTVGENTENLYGLKLPKFVPCLGGRCPELMQLHGEDTDNMYYRCQRTAGYKSTVNGELYTGNCLFHDEPYPAKDYAYWHRDAQKKTDRMTRNKTAV